MLQSKALLLMPVQLLFPEQWFGKLHKASRDLVRGLAPKLHQRIPPGKIGLSNVSPIPSILRQVIINKKLVFILSYARFWVKDSLFLSRRFALQLNLTGIVYLLMW